MPIQTGILPAGSTLTVDYPIGETATISYQDGDIGVVENGQTKTTDRTIGPFANDVAYSIYYTGWPKVFTTSAGGAITTISLPLPEPSSVPVGQAVSVGNDVGISNGVDWRWMPQAKGVIALDSSLAGDDSGWLPSSSSPERFGFLLSGSSAVVSITGSNDAESVAAGYLVTVTMDTQASTFVTPPMNLDYKFIKFTVMSLGVSSSIKVSRGV